MVQVEFGKGTIDQNAYFKSFGEIQEGSVYYDPFGS
jgi:hypothetical protein